MAGRTQTYAIRLAVEGGGQVKAELVSVGQSGEQSLKRIESASPTTPPSVALQSPMSCLTEACRSMPLVFRCFTRTRSSGRSH
jgi:hypothetical protein